MSNGTKYTWEQLQETEASALKRGEFQGMVLEALKNLRSDIQDIQTDQRNTRYISMFIAGLSGVLSGIFGSTIK